MLPFESKRGRRGFYAVLGVMRTLGLAKAIKPKGHYRVRLDLLLAIKTANQEATTDNLQDMFELSHDDFLTGMDKVSCE
jgi:hypothetical protein